MIPPSISVVIPALNEASTISMVVATFLPHPNVSEVIVVDNNSTDATAQEAGRAGARVIHCPTPGAGAAVATGLRAATHDWVFKCDGDIRNPQLEWIDILIAEINDDVGLVKGNWYGPEDDLPVTNLVVKPGVELFFPQLAYVEMPITGLYLVDRTAIIIDHLRNDYSFDLQVAIQVHILGRKIRQVFLGNLLHRQKKSSEYTGMALELFSYLIQVHGQKSVERVLVMAETCEDAFLWSGGTILKYLLAGAKVTMATLCPEAPGKGPIPGFLAQFSNFCHREWSSTAGLPPSDISDPRGDFSVVLSPSSVGDGGRTMPFSRRFLYTDHMRGGISYGERPLHTVDISDVAPLKHRILATMEGDIPVNTVRVCRLSDEINGLRCGTGFAEVFSATPGIGLSQARGFL